MPAPPTRPGPEAPRSPGHAVNAIALVGLSLLVFGTLTCFVDPDVYHGLSLIREALDEGRIPEEDRFAYTRTVSPVVHHEWLAAAVLYWTATRTGAVGFVALKYVLTAAIAAGCFLLARRRGASVPVFVLLAPVMLFFFWIGMTTIRAQVFSLLFLVVLFHLLESDRRGARWWMLPWAALHVLWLNIHAGFLLGLVFLAAHALEQRLRQRQVRHLLILLPVLCVLVPLNPYGLDYFAYLWRAVLFDRSLIREWDPLWTGWYWLIALYVFSVLVYAGSGLARQGLRRAPGWALVLPAAAAGLRHMRHLSVYSVAWLAYCPPLIEASRLGEMMRDLWRRRLPWVLGVWTLVGAAGARLAVERKPWELVVPCNPGDHPELLYPVGAAKYLDEVGFEGNLWTPFDVGAFITWKLEGRVKVSLDGRYEVAYPPGAKRQSEDFYAAAPGWRTTLERYPTDAVLVRSSQPVAGALEAETTWTLAYRDDVYQVYTREGVDLPFEDRTGVRLTASFP